MAKEVAAELILAALEAEEQIIPELSTVTAEGQLMEAAVAVAVDRYRPEMHLFAVDQVEESTV